ncbi:MAG: bis(5'-nucleosyl)-tetraphosphatase (symmetrical) YqeK [Acholeplasmatales bacterium]|nr:bis(5'-nucleosyl)-tetraphosphatase (symmetrical) YqeK [Acholeplasmatales bacterium]
MLLSDKAKQLVIEKYGDQHEHRLQHVFGVAEMASFLAKKYGVDEEKALIAAYMHDYAKYDDPSEAIGILTDKEIEECEKYPFLYHAYLSAEAYLANIGNDMEIYNAIKYHVFGRPHMSLLEAIIMIADYTEKNREYPTCIECRKILLDGDMDLAIYKSLEYTIAHCKENNESAHPMQLLVLKEYEMKSKKLKLEDVIVDSLGKVKAKNIVIYDSEGRNPFYDKIIISSVDSMRQCSAAIKYIEEDLSINNYKVRSIDGKDSAWVLIDCYDVIVSIFEREEREHFDIDKLYMDYPKRIIEE